MKFKIALFALTVSVLGLAYAASTVDAKKSSVTITARQLNVPMSAKFTKVSGTVDYNKAAPEKTKATIEIDISSFDLGDPEYNKEVLKKDWFNAPQFPKATFVASAITVSPKGVMTASGNLTIKGKTLPVSFPVSIRNDSDSTVFDGALPIHRLAYNIGEGDWADTGTVADEVIIKFHVVVTP